MAHGSGQTITGTPWEALEYEAERRERGDLKWRRLRGVIRHPEAYAAAAAFNAGHGLTPVRVVVTDAKLKFLRRRRGGLKTSKRVVRGPGT